MRKITLIIVGLVALFVIAAIGQQIIILSDSMQSRPAAVDRAVAAALR